jgi:hypothetical protein
MTVGGIFSATVADETDEERRELERFVLLRFSPLLYLASSSSLHLLVSLERRLMNSCPACLYLSS